MKVLRKAIAVMDADKPYWKNLFAAQKGRYQRVADTNGDLLNN